MCVIVDKSTQLCTLSHMPTTDCARQSTVSTMSSTARARLLELARHQGIVTAREARQAGIHSQQLTRLVAEGLLERSARGQYHLVERPVTEYHALVMASKALPRGVICLLSALDVHGIGTQLPGSVWIAVERGTHVPRIPELPLEVMRFSGAAFSLGIETHQVEGHDLRVYSVAKTLADLFRCRNKVGLDVAVEALREAWQGRRFTMDNLDEAAHACRVERVMRPYVEAVVS